jgi:plastocyanin
MKSKRYIIICFLIVFLVTGCAKKEAAPSDEDLVEEISEPVLKKVLTIAEVDLTAEKIMVPDKLTIKKGTMVRWNNKDKNFNHNLFIYPAEIERPKQEDIIVQSGNIAPSEQWDYVFEESGNYIVRDIYSGTMKGEITAEAAADISGAEIIGRINAE